MGYQKESNMKYQDSDPQYDVLIRLEWPIYKFLKGEAQHNKTTVTQLCKYYFAEGFGRKKADIILEKARKE
jgi:hypothetical protein